MDNFHIDHLERRVTALEQELMLLRQDNKRFREQLQRLEVESKPSKASRLNQSLGSAYEQMLGDMP